ncbi:MAG: HEAT repeat domain-containing protein [Pirellulaceae bacterium]
MYRLLLSAVVSFLTFSPIGCGRSASPPAPRLEISIPSDASEDVRRALDVFNSAAPLDRARALSSLRESPMARAQATSCCVTALQDANYLVRARAAELLGESGDTSAMDPLVEMLEERAEHDRVRSAVAEALGRLKAREATQPLIAMLKDMVWNVRYQAAVALGRIGDPAATEALREAATYEANALVRDAVEKSLLQCSGALHK